MRGGGYRAAVRELNSRKSPTARKILFSEDSRLETATEGREGGIDVVREDVISVHEGSSRRAQPNNRFNVAVDA